MLLDLLHAHFLRTKLLTQKSSWKNISTISSWELFFTKDSKNPFLPKMLNYVMPSLKIYIWCYQKLLKLRLSKNCGKTLYSLSLSLSLVVPLINRASSQ